VTACELLNDLARRGVKLSLDGDRLRYRAPVGALGPGIREAIIAHRAEIITHLKQTMQTNRNDRDKCCWCDPKDWIDEPPNNGRIRTTCGKCGKFIGYRPIERARRRLEF